MDAIWRIELLGCLRAAGAHGAGDRVVARFRTQTTGALLAFLALNGRRSHSREELIEHHWPGSDPDAGRQKLSVALSSLRHQLEPPGVPSGAVIVADRISVRLNPAGYLTDVAQFETGLQNAMRSGDRGPSAWERIQRLEAAAELYRGDLLPGYYEEWILSERQRLAEMYVQALSQLIALLEQIGDMQGALRWARRVVTADPLREEGHRDLMRLLNGTGQPEAALRQYRELERLLELACVASPEPESSALADTITSGMARSQERVNGVVGISLQAASPPPVPSPFFPPTGTITFLLTEIPGSPAAGEPGTEPEGQTSAEAAAVPDGDLELLLPIFSDHGGHLVLGAGGTLTVAFGRASDALAAAVAARKALVHGHEAVDHTAETHEATGLGRLPRSGHGTPDAVLQDGSAAHMPRMSLHTGEIEPGEEITHSAVLKHTAQLLLAAHPGQILLSEKCAVLVGDPAEPNLRLIDLGLYRLTAHAAPERLYQVHGAEILAGGFPSPHARRAHTGNLPLRLTRFFGREPEITHLREMLRVENCRLVTLTGPGGSGKTRLAQEVAAGLREWLPGDAWFVPLVDLAAPGLVADKLLDTLRLPRSPAITPLEQVIAFLSRHSSLLVLDNFEHLLPEGAPLVRRLLERVETLTVLVTSRQRLGLDGEHEVPVPPLPIPPAKADLEQLASCESVRLFLDRAQAVRPDFQVTQRNAAAIAELCAKLEGLPLALELAAARAGVLTPSQMLSHLSQRFELLTRRGRGADLRHRSMRAALDWSYQLLTPELQQVFAWLSVFRGGWTLAAAESLCEDPMVLEKLEQLRESSLVLAEEDRTCPRAAMRYRLLETVREYGAAHLTPDEQRALTERHLRYYVQLAEQAEAEWASPAQEEWLGRLEQEQDNLRTALASAAAGPDVDLGLRLGGALWWFWWVRSQLREGQQQLEQLLSITAGAGETPRRSRLQACAGTLAFYQGEFTAARAFAEASLTSACDSSSDWSCALSLNTLGRVAWAQGDGALAHRFHEESLAVWRRLQDRWGMAYALSNLGYIAKGRGDFEEARLLLEEGLVIRRDLGDRLGIAQSLSSLALVAFVMAEYETASSMFKEALAIFRELGNATGVVGSLWGLGDVLRKQGEHATAGARYEESLTLARQVGDKRGITYSLSGLGDIALGEKEYARARACFEESLALRQERGTRQGIADSLIDLGHLAQREGDQEAAAAHCREALTIYRELLDRFRVIGALERLAEVEMECGRPEKAVRWFAAAAALRREIGAPRPPRQASDFEKHLASLSSALGETSFTAAWEEGEAQPWEQVVAEAIGCAAPVRPGGR